MAIRIIRVSPFSDMWHLFTTGVSCTGENRDILPEPQTVRLAVVSGGRHYSRRKFLKQKQLWWTTDACPIQALHQHSWCRRLDLSFHPHRPCIERQAPVFENAERPKVIEMQLLSFYFTFCICLLHLLHILKFIYLLDRLMYIGILPTRLRVRECQTPWN